MSAAGLQPLEGAERKLATLGLSLATFMNVLDTTIANVSLSTIAGELGASPSQGTWVITSFAVSTAISVPLTGWLAQRFGQVRLFMLSLLLFVLFSWLCGLSTSLGMLIVFRVLQGLVAGPMVPLSQALLMQSYPPAKAGMALAIWAMTTLVAPVMGPVLGGWISDNAAWSWIFYINIPTGLFSAWLCWRIFRHRESPIVSKPVDSVGLILLVLWVGALQIMLDKGKELDWFGSPEIVALGVVALVGFCFFLVWELTEAHPIVDLYFFKRHNYLIGTLSLSLAYCIFFGNVVIMPLWMQLFLGYTATWSGLVTAPVGFLAVLLSPLVGKRLPHTDPRLFSTLCFFIFALTAWMRAGFTTTPAYIDLVVPQIIQGIATACFFVPLLAISFSGLAQHQIASATGLSNFVRITAGSFGASLFTTLWERRAAFHHARLSETISAARPASQQALDVLTAQGMGQDQALGFINRTIDVQAATLGANEFFMLSAVVYASLMAVVWFSRPVLKRPG